MKQVRITGPFAFQVEEVPVPAINDTEVLLKIECLGICASDMQIYHGKHKFMTFPVILGHEASAVVERAGAGVSGFSPGDRVTIEPQVFCGSCFPCEQGRFNVCENLSVIGVHRDGCSREYIGIDPKYLHKIPPSMGAEPAALTEPFAVGVGAVRRSRNLAGANVAVVGAGTIGNFAAQAAKALGAGRVMIADINQRKLDFARECGIDSCVNTAGLSLDDAVRKCFGRRRADIIIDCAAVPAGFRSIMEAARPDSEIIITGNYKEPVEFNVPFLQRREISLIGHMMYVREDFGIAIKLLAEGKIAASNIVTRVFPFREYGEAFQYADAHSDSIMKVMIAM
ncbi:MAG: alcohol dehydrogenase catalytic domain-containing protein [Treponema sp.]|jgi:L-iditol 2-dehydrogenase|nr:alcohol dehydrogenase catalytic domain-containing protein [Treponema sp.]